MLGRYRCFWSRYRFSVFFSFFKSRFWFFKNIAISILFFGFIYLFANSLVGAQLIRYMQHLRGTQRLKFPDLTNLSLYVSMSLYVFLWSNQLSVLIWSFPHPRHPSNSSSSSSFCSYSTCKFTCLQQTWLRLLQFTLYFGISQVKSEDKLQRIQNSLARVIKHTSKYQHITPTLWKTTLASNQTKNRVQTLSSQIQNTYTSTIVTIVFHFRTQSYYYFWRKKYYVTYPTIIEY